MKAIYIISFVLIGLQIPSTIAQDQSSLTQTSPEKYVDQDTLAKHADEHLKNCNAFIEIKQYEHAMDECNRAIGFIEYNRRSYGSEPYLSNVAFAAYLKGGDLYMRRKEYERAAYYYYRASTFYSNCGEPHPTVSTRLGEAYFLAGDYTKAVYAYMQGLSDSQHLEECLICSHDAHHAEVLYRTEKVEDAAKLFHNVVVSYGKRLQAKPRSWLIWHSDQEFLDYIQLTSTAVPLTRKVVHVQRAHKKTRSTGALYSRA